MQSFSKSLQRKSPSLLWFLEMILKLKVVFEFNQVPSDDFNIKTKLIILINLSLYNIMIKVLSHKLTSQNKKNIEFCEGRLFSLNDISKKEFTISKRSLIVAVARSSSGWSDIFKCYDFITPLSCVSDHMCACCCLIPPSLQHQSSTPTSSIMMHERHHVWKIKRPIFRSLLSCACMISVVIL